MTYPCSSSGIETAPVYGANGVKRYGTVSCTAPTTKRGLLRLALISMILWNLFVWCLAFKSVVDERSSKILAAYENKSLRMKSNTHPVCDAEYEAYARGYSLWAEFKKQFPPSSIAILELFPPGCDRSVVGCAVGHQFNSSWVLHGFGIQFKRPQTSDAPTLMQRLQGAGRWAIAPKNLFALSVGLVEVAVSLLLPRFTSSF